MACQEVMDKVFLKMAINLSEVSQCVSHQVGSLIVKNNKILSSGINGTPPGWLNCNEVFDPENFDRDDHKAFSDSHEIHAEMNAVINAAKEGISIDGATIYCTHEPCYQCSKNIVFSGIKRIVFNKEYDRNHPIRQALQQFLLETNIQIEQLDI